MLLEFLDYAYVKRFTTTDRKLVPDMQSGWKVGAKLVSDPFDPLAVEMSNSDP